MTDYGESIVEVEPKDVKKYVAGLVGEEPTDSEDTTTSETPKIDASTVTVDVANASDVGGLANGVADALTSLGYGQGEVGNYTGASVSETTVFAHSADDDAPRRSPQHSADSRPTPTRHCPKARCGWCCRVDYQGPTSAETTAPPRRSESSETARPHRGGTTPPRHRPARRSMPARRARVV